MLGTSHCRVISVDRVNHVFQDVRDLESESTRMNCVLHPESLCGCYVPFKEEPPVAIGGTFIVVSSSRQ